MPVHNSETSCFGNIELRNVLSRITPGPSVHRRYASIGFSDSHKDDKTFGGLALDEELAQHGTSARCGISVIDLRTGDVAHWARFAGQVTELYDVVVLPGVDHPMSFGFKTDEIQRTLALGDPGML
jgi:hypothetical protein